MLFVKICGITRSEDALCAISAGADAIGFVAFPGSKRYVSPGQVARIVTSISESSSWPNPQDRVKLEGGNIPHLRLVGVFVNEKPDIIADYLVAGLNTIQFHGDETAEVIQTIKERLGMLGVHMDAVESWKAIRPKGVDSLESEGWAGYPVDKYIVDTPPSTGADIYGGSGVVGDWSVARRAVEILRRPVILAGGLTPCNVGEAVAGVKPFGVDVSSGIEMSPGVKDPGCIGRFITVARESAARL